MVESPFCDDDMSSPPVDGIDHLLHVLFMPPLVVYEISEISKNEYLRRPALHCETYTTRRGMALTGPKSYPRMDLMCFLETSPT